MQVIVDVRQYLLQMHINFDISKNLQNMQVFVETRKNLHWVWGYGMLCLFLYLLLVICYLYWHNDTRETR
jgi:hypothetical protein